MDEELMAGISESKEAPGNFTAFVVRHTTGETLGVQEFTNVFEAIRTLNGIPREWKYEPVSQCGSGNCGSGKCGKEGGACNRKSGSKSESEPCSTGAC